MVIGFLVRQGISPSFFVDSPTRAINLGEDLADPVALGVLGAEEVASLAPIQSQWAETSPRTDCPPAGKIQRYLDNWKCVTHDKFILKIVQFGYKLQFISNPFQSSPLISKPSHEKLDPLIFQINHHLQTGAISEI